MIDRGFIGLRLPPHTVQVEAGRLRFFARVIGETDPVQFDEAAARAAGYPALPVPPTFLFCLDMDVPEPYAYLGTMGIDLGRILHGEQHFTYHDPVHAGDWVRFESVISDIYARKGGALEFVVRDTAVSRPEGSPVADLRSVIAVRNAAGVET